MGIIAPMFYYPSTLAWRLTLCLALADAFLLPLVGLTMDLKGPLTILAVTTSLIVAATIYQRLRPEPAIHAATSATAYLVLFTASAVILSYVMARAALPLQDEPMIWIDRALGFDFVEHLRVITTSPTLIRILHGVYFSLQPQILIVVLGLSLLDRTRLRIFIHAYAISALVSIITFGFLPAIGSYEVYAPDAEIIARLLDPQTGRWHLPVLMEVRERTLNHLDLFGMQGLIQFPSFHAALAVVMTYGLWGIRYLALPGLILNAVMMFATVGIGGHYIIDVIMGSLLATLTIWQLHRHAQRAL
jgi:membrane-associated phospholipid phosphatase